MNLLSFNKDFIQYPFKFNSTWLTEEDFNDLIRDEWDVMCSAPSSSTSPMKSFLHKLRLLQPVVRNWEKSKKRAMSSNICRIETDICTIENSLLVDPESEVL